MNKNFNYLSDDKITKESDRKNHVMHHVYTGDTESCYIQIVRKEYHPHKGGFISK